MAKYTVSWAGTTSCNGEYNENGTYGAQPAYEKSGGGMWMWYLSMFGKWMMSTSLGGGTNYYMTQALQPITGTWEVDTGDSPAPTVTLYSPSGSGTSNAKFSQTISAENSKGTSNGATFNQVISKYKESTKSITHTNGFNQIVVGKVGEYVDSYLGLDDDAAYYIVKTISQNNRYSQTVNKYKIHSESHSRTARFSQTAVGVRARAARSYLTFEGEAHRAYTTTPYNDLTAEQELHKIEYSDPTSGFGQSVTVELVKAISSGMGIAQSVSPAQSVYNRTGISDVEFESIVRQYVQRGTSYSENGINWNARVDNDNPAVCETVTCTRNYITLDYLGTTVDLRNPQSDTQGLNLNVINAYIRGEELQHYKNSYPTFETLNYTFTHLLKSKRDEFFTFYKLTAGLEIQLTDYCGDTWIGVITDHDIRSENYAGGVTCEDGLVYNLSFKFEGVKI